MLVGISLLNILMSSNRTYSGFKVAALVGDEKDVSRHSHSCRYCQQQQSHTYPPDPDFPRLITRHLSDFTKLISLF